MKYRLDFSIVCGTPGEAAGAYNYMLGIAQHATAINPGMVTEEPTIGNVTDATLTPLLGYKLSSEGLEEFPSVALGDGPFIVSGSSFYPTAGHAENAFAQIRALAEQSALGLNGQQMALFIEPLRPSASTGRIHVCRHEEGLPCVDAETFAIPLPAPSDGIEWASGESLGVGEVRLYQGVAYITIQNPGVNIWPPPTVPALWEAL